MNATQERGRKPIRASVRVQTKICAEKEEKYLVTCPGLFHSPAPLLGTSVWMRLTAFPSCSRRDQLPTGRSGGAACLSGPSSQPVWIFSLNRHHSLFRVTLDSLGFPGTFLYLHWPIAAPMVSSEVVGSDKTLIRTRSEGSQLSSSWPSFPLFLQSLEPISPSALRCQPFHTNPPCLQDLGSGWGGTA